jgi:endonuclease G, mitochondrial
MPKTRADRAAAFLKDIAGDDGLDGLRVDAAAADALNQQRRQHEATMGIESMSLDVDAATINGAIESVMTDRPLAPDQAATIRRRINSGFTSTMPTPRPDSPGWRSRSAASKFPDRNILMAGPVSSLARAW